MLFKGHENDIEMMRGCPNPLYTSCHKKKKNTTQKSGTLYFHNAVLFCSKNISNLQLQQIQLRMQETNSLLQTKKVASLKFKRLNNKATAAKVWIWQCRSCRVV